MKNLFLVLFSLVFSFANAQQKNWQDIDESAISTQVIQARTLIPDHVRSVQYDYDDFKRVMAEAPMEEMGRRIEAGVTISVPYPNGEDVSFLMVESPNMQAGISARYPSIKSYRGRGIEDRRQSLRIVISPLGIHGVASSDKGPVYLDPYEMGNLEYVQSYYVKDHHQADHIGLQLGCGTSDADHGTEWATESLGESSVEATSSGRAGGEVVTERLYRMAIAATGEWTSQLFNASVTDGLAAMNISVARLNSIWERDIAIRGILIDQEDELIFTSPGTDPYFNANMGGVLLSQNTDVINETIGAGAYDFGHVYTASCTDVGGIAQLGTPCGPNKGGGVTCHYSSNLEYVTVSIAGHEMGHQLSATHTFNNCGPNITTATAYEPGSGSTIMSYSGLCGDQNIQGPSDDYYHVSSLRQMIQFTQEGNGDFCPEKIVTENMRPEVNFPYEDGFFIPIGTPFYLEADGIDENGDVLTYTFEQYDLGPVSPLGSPMGNAPSFRSIYPNDDNFRYFPLLEDVVNNTSNIREVLPSVTRDMTFRVAVRDFNEAIGSSNWDELKFYATDEAGPFSVMSPNEGTEVAVGGADYEITWDVANTDGELVNCQLVNILLSTDGGYTFDKVLANQIPNDGSHVVVFPDIVSNTARVKIEGDENVFYDMSNNNFSIEAPVGRSITIFAKSIFTAGLFANCT